MEQGHEPQAKAPARQEQIEQGDADIDNAHGQGKQNYGKDGQRKVDPGKAVAGNGAEKLAAIVVKDLEIPFGPAHALAAGLAEGDRLFVVHDRGAAVGDALALDHAVDGELDILREQKVLPAAVARHDLAVDEKARARDGAARAEEHAALLRNLDSRWNHSAYPAEIQLLPQFLELR